MSGPDFSKAEFTTSYGLSNQLPQAERPEYVFSGRSNVGKSSLINKLCNRKKLARTSSTPGKTATINFYSAGEAYLVDLPGYGYAKTSATERTRWDGLINGYFRGNRNIVCVVQLLDCRHKPSKDDEQMLDYLTHYKIPFVVVLTKGDKLRSTAFKNAVQEFEEYLASYECSKIIITSAEKGTGIEELSAVLKDFE